MVRSKPRLLLFQGEFLLPNMEKERIVKSEIFAAVREQGIADLEDVFAVVIETDASLSVIQKKINSGKSTLEDVEGLPAAFKNKIQSKL